MFIDTLGSGLKATLPTTVGGQPAAAAVRVVGDPTVCRHYPVDPATALAHVDPVVAQAFRIETTGQRVVLLANTRNQTLTVAVQGAAGGRFRTVDFDAGFRKAPWAERRIDASGVVTLSGFGVGLVLVPPNATTTRGGH